MVHLRDQKFKNKLLKNNILELEKIFKPINISIIDMDKLKRKKKKRTNKEENIYKKHLVNELYS